MAHFNGIDLSLAHVRELATGFVAAFPDLKLSIRSMEVEGDCVRLHARDTATHRIETGKIAEVWQQVDVEESTRQFRAGMRDR